MSGNELQRSTGRAMERIASVNNGVDRTVSLEERSGRINFDWPSRRVEVSFDSRRAIIEPSGASAGRKCSGCGDTGHNVRTCSGAN